MLDFKSLIKSLCSREKQKEKQNKRTQRTVLWAFRPQDHAVELEENSPVRFQFTAHGEWEAGTVTGIHDHNDGSRTYDVRADSGDHERRHVPRQQLRMNDGTGREPIAATAVSSSAIPMRACPLDSANASASKRAAGSAAVLLFCIYLHPDRRGIRVSVACGSVWDKDSATVTGPRHLVPLQVTEFKIFICSRISADKTTLQVHSAKILAPEVLPQKNDDDIDLLLLQAVGRPRFPGALPLRPPELRRVNVKDENVWVLGWAKIPGQDGEATLQKLSAQIVSVGASSELRLNMPSFKGLSGAIVYDEAGYKIGQVLDKSGGFAFAANFTACRNKWRKFLEVATWTHLDKSIDSLNTDAPVPACASKNSSKNPSTSTSRWNMWRLLIGAGILVPIAIGLCWLRSRTRLVRMMHVS